MDETLIANWNQKVKNSDTVYVLGDLIYKAKNPATCLERLNGKKILIKGNHDDTWLSNIAENEYFSQVTLMLELNLQGKMFTLCHYPLLEWQNSRKDGAKQGYLMHGHTHNRVSPKYEILYNTPNALNVGVDINDFSPVTLNELIENNKKFKENLQ